MTARMKAKRQVMVKKFGGTSVGSLERIEAVAERLVEDFNAGQAPVVVASAMSGETNRLVRLASELNPYYRGSAYDMLLASGEQVSIALLTIALEKRGVKAEPLLAHQVGIKTDGLSSKARIQYVNTEKLLSLVESDCIPVVAGFQGMAEGNKLTTLGRGGSDTTAVALAAALGCEECEIYTDVPAVFSADPRLVPEAREISRLSFEEMMEMASVGSKVLHFRCVEIAAKYNVKIHLRSTFERRKGTLIQKEDNMLENPVVSSVTHDPDTVVVKLNPVPEGAEFLSKLFGVLAEKGIVVDIITQSQVENGQRLNFSIPSEDLPQTEIILKDLISDQVEIQIIPNMAKISTIGVGMKNHPGVAARFFRILKEVEADVHLVTTSDIKISAVIPKAQLEKTAKALHTEFSLDK